MKGKSLVVGNIYQIKDNHPYHANKRGRFVFWGGPEKNIIVLANPDDSRNMFCVKLTDLRDDLISGLRIGPLTIDTNLQKITDEDNGLVEENYEQDRYIKVGGFEFDESLATQLQANDDVVWVLQHISRYGIAIIQMDDSFDMYEVIKLLSLAAKENIGNLFNTSITKLGNIYS